MSIPKEPRALMINIMYLVLTALLALNVSAEIFNAFKLVDKGLIKSNTALDEKNNALPSAITEGAKKKNSLATYAERIDPIRNSSKDLVDYIEGLKKDMIDKTGGYKENSDDLKGKKDKDITTRTLVDGGVGEELKAKLLEYRESILSNIDGPMKVDGKDVNDQESFQREIAVQVDDETWKTKKKKSWSEMNFKQMPLQATLPILTKYINDVKATESAALNYLANKVGTSTDVVLDKFTVVSSPEKSYIIKGEKFKTEVFLTAFAGADSKTGISLSVDGRNLKVDSDGRASFEETASKLGVRKYTVKGTITNPVTGDTDTYTTAYEYEVGERSVAISPTKMNVFYIGVDNPIEVSAAGVSSSQIKVSMGGAGGGKISKNGDGTYNVTVSSPTSKGQFAKVNVSAPGMNAGKDFRVKRIPDPVPKLSKARGGGMSPGEFKIQPGVFPVLENFDFDAKCNIVGFKLVRVPKRADPQVAVNRGGKYSSESKSLVDKAKPSDKFFFEDIKCKCPGDGAARDLGGMVFNIK